MFETTIEQEKNAYDTWKKSTTMVDQVSASTLNEIINYLSNTKYAQDYSFNKVKSPADLSAYHPITNANHYRPYIDRMIKGEKNVLVPTDEIFMYYESSGTTGNPNIFPVVQAIRKRHAVSTHPIVHHSIRQHNPEWLTSKAPIIGIYANKHSGEGRGELGGGRKDANGIPITVSSDYVRRCLMAERPFPFSSPQTVFDQVPDEENSLFLHALCALIRPDIIGIRTTFILRLLPWFSILNLQRNDLIQCLETKKVLPSLVPKASNETINDVNALLKQYATPQRIEEIKSFYQRHPSYHSPLDLTQIWPHLSYIRAGRSGPMNAYMTQIEQWLGPNISAFLGLLGGSEGVTGYNYDMKQPNNFAFIPSLAYYELIPEKYLHLSDNNNNDNNSIKTVSLSEAKIGESYEIVMTNFNGLIRYRIGDVIRIVDKVNNQLPLFTLSHRVGTMLDYLNNGTIGEHQVQTALEKIIEKNNNYRLIHWTADVVMNAKNGHYRVFINIENNNNNNNKPNTNDLSTQLENYLLKENIDYAEARKDGSIPSPFEVLLVDRKGFNELRMMLGDRIKCIDNVKIPRRLRREEQIKLLEKYTIV